MTLTSLGDKKRQRCIWWWIICCQTIKHQRWILFLYQTIIKFFSIGRVKQLEVILTFVLKDFRNQSGEESSMNLEILFCVWYLLEIIIHAWSNLLSFNTLENLDTIESIKRTDERRNCLSITQEAFCSISVLNRLPLLLLLLFGSIELIFGFE